ncbi:MAG TPA: DUF4258 domain-containing protein [Parafilimonas sp.]|jgi:hypothetical protein|nr:DUF4258 domain-containing protein [Parafilimonas sp.]
MKRNLIAIVFLFFVTGFGACTSSVELNRNPARIIYTRHARCRMNCRHINQTEVMEILQDGEINYRKSELNNKDCYKKFAVEGFTKEHQHLRIIFAPCESEEVVVTVIDLETEWSCDCE